MATDQRSSGLVFTPQVSHSRGSAPPSAPPSARGSTRGRVTSANIATRLGAAKTREERTALLMAQQRPGLSELSCVPVKPGPALNSSYTSGALIAGSKRLPPWGSSGAKTPSLLVSEREKCLPNEVRRWASGDYGGRPHIRVTESSLSSKASNGVRAAMTRTNGGPPPPAERPRTCRATVRQPPAAAAQREPLFSRRGAAAAPPRPATAAAVTPQPAAPREDLGTVLVPRMGRKRTVPPPPDHVTNANVVRAPPASAPGSRAPSPTPGGRAPSPAYTRTPSNPITHAGERAAAPQLRGRVSQTLIAGRSASEPPPQLPRRPAIGSTQRTRYTPRDNAAVFADTAAATRRSSAPQSSAPQSSERRSSVRRVQSSSPVRPCGANPNAAAEAAPGSARAAPARGVRPAAPARGLSLGELASGTRRDGPPLAPRPAARPAASTAQQRGW